MNSIINMSLLSMMALSMIHAEKPYDVKSAKIEFEIKTTSNNMEEIGKQRVLIDNYGERELVEINKVRKIHTKVIKQHTLLYIHEPVAYRVNFKRKRISRITNYNGTTFGIRKGNGTTEEMLRKRKGKKIGTDRVAGQTCDVWKFGDHMTQCIYKGLPLREEIISRGGSTLKRATKVELDVALKVEDFKLPNFPIDGKNYTQAQLEAMDTQAKQKDQKRAKKHQETLTLMDKALQNAGVKKGEHPTPEQRKKVGAYMANATFPTRKEEILEELRAIPKLKKCYQNASSMKEAYACDTDADFESYQWGSKEKVAFIQKLEAREKMLPCLEKAQNMQEMQQCDTQH